MESSRSQPPSEPEAFARSYQLEALEMAVKKNTIVYLETGSGKTLIAVMLLRRYAHLIRKPSESIAIFLVPTVILVSQQADVIEKHTDLKVGRFWGDMGVDFWDESIWNEKLQTFEVFVMTPQILLNNLRHCLFDLVNIELLIFDECHHAKGKHPYALIMTEFYHRHLNSGFHNVPRIFGMTASLINSKGSGSRIMYQEHIMKLESLMNSKVYTTESESDLAKYIPFSTAKIELYDPEVIPENLQLHLESNLEVLKDKYVRAVDKLELDVCAIRSTKRRIEKLHDTFLYCLEEFGVWLTWKAADIHSHKESVPCLWAPLRDANGEKQVCKFSEDAAHLFASSIPSGYSVGYDLEEDIRAGYVTTRVVCLIRSLMDYRERNDMRCIIFVQRVIVAVALKSFLGTIPQFLSWGMRHMAGYHSGWQHQTRKEHLSIVELFREGKVNIIVATQILEEGLDVQSCNLVIRFDPSPTVSSFIQSRGRARLQDSDYLLIINSNDLSTQSRVKKYLQSGHIMREESQKLSAFDCAALSDATLTEAFYCVEQTGAIVTLSSSVQLIYFYCSRLPADRYFKPQPRFQIDKDLNSCTLLLPKNCPIPSVYVDGVIGNLKAIVCLEACKQLHDCGALSDKLLPVNDVEVQIHPEEADNSGLMEYGNYFPGELIDTWSSFCAIGKYHGYRISMTNNSDCKFSFRDIILIVKLDLGPALSNVSFELETDWGNISVHISYLGLIELQYHEVELAKRFQVSLLGTVIHHNFDIVKCILDHLHHEESHFSVSYLLLPSAESCEYPFVDWNCLRLEKILQAGLNLSGLHHCLDGKCRPIQMRNGCVNSCVIKDSLIYTPHNNFLYLITGFYEGSSGYSELILKSGETLTYRKYYKTRHGINLHHPGECLLAGQHILLARNFLRRKSSCKKRDDNFGIELPPELCEIILSPIELRTLHSYSFLPSIMSRVESLLLAARIVRLDDGIEGFTAPAVKVLEAITTKKCGEKFSLESLEALGDSFLKYAATVNIYKNNKQHHEGILSLKRECIISNSSLHRIACCKKLPGFIRNEEFNPKTWSLPGACHGFCMENEFQCLELKHIVCKGTRTMKRKVVSDMVEALIGLCVFVEGEQKAIIFMSWLGIDINNDHGIPNGRPSLTTTRVDFFVNVSALECILKYKFRDSSLLVEALTHGSYQIQEISRCYQLLEFLGDAVLDYIITIHIYGRYPGISPGLLTDLRSASVNNDCYAHAAVKAGLHKHILHASSELHRHLEICVDNIQKSSSLSSYGWKADSASPKVLGDIIESLAGAIFVDSGYSKEIVLQSMMPLLEPFPTPETIEYHPVKELTEICSRKGYQIDYRKNISDNGLQSMMVEVTTVDGRTFGETKTDRNIKTAKKLAAKAVLEALKASALSESSV